MSVIGRIMCAMGARRFKRMVAAAADPEPVQDRLWRAFMQKGAKTAWGRDHGLATIADIRDYQRKIPLSRHEDVFAYWDRAFHGEPDVIWPGYIRYWGMSSGTTSAAGSNKYIPLTPDTIKTNKAGGFDALASYLHHTRDTNLIAGPSKILFLGGSTVLTEIPSKFRPTVPNFHGDNTGIMAQFLPRWVRKYYSPGHELAWMSNWEEKVEKIAEVARKQDIRVITGVPSWMAILFDRVRAKEGGKPIGEIWPNLRLYVHGGMSFHPYRDLFREHIGRDIFYVDSYSATEGGMLSVQDRLGGDDYGQLAIVDLGVVFEFVPAEMADQPHPESHLIHEVQPGVNYAVVMTTNAGLYRYVVGDTVKFVETHPPRLVFTGRLKTFLNFFGEHVILSELESAIAHASAAVGATVKDFTVVPVFPSKEQPIPQHRWYVEFADHPPADLARFAHLIDEDIRHRSNNLDYDSHRVADQGLRMPEIVAVPATTFYVWMKRRGKLGGQNKVPRALTDADLIQSLEATLRDLASPISSP